MINSYYKILRKIKFFSFILFSMTFLSCGSFSTSGYLASDGIYGTKNQVKTTQNGTNQNGIYYKNYFDQKAQEYGLNNQVNDSIITDVNSYSNTTNSSNIAYTNSYGSWGDNPTSINFIYNDIFRPYWGHYYQPYYMNSWYNYYYSPFYSPYYSWHYYPYEGYGRYNYWNFMFRPWGYGGYSGYGGYFDPYYNRYNENNIAFMNGRRGTNSNNSSSSTGSANSSSYSTSIGSRSISNYNVGRNDTEDSSSQDEVNKTRNINRMYYVLKNSRSVRNYLVPRDGDELGGNNGGGNVKKGNDSRPYTGSSGKPSDFQLSKYGNSSSRSYNVSRSSSGSTNNSSSSGRSYDVSRSSSGSSSSSRPSYSSSSSSSRSSGGGRPSAPSSSSGGSSKGPR